MLVRLLAAGQKNLTKKTAKNNTYKSEIKIPTLYCCRKRDSCLHCKFRNGEWRPRATFRDSVVTFDNAIIYIDDIRHDHYLFFSLCLVERTHREYCPSREGLCI